jgi:hypothetical protein
MNLFVLFGDGAITRKKKMTETLLRAMMQFPVIFFSGVILPHQTKK